MLATPRDYRREILMDDSVHDGDPVYPQYYPTIHENGLPAKEIANCRGQLYGAWDAGSSRQPTFLLSRLSAGHKQLRHLMEVRPERPMSMNVFAPIVKTRLMNFIPGEWGNVIHLGDATIGTMSGADEKSAQSVAREYGFSIKPINNNVALRLKAVGDLLVDWCDETGSQPRMIFSTEGCPVLCEAMGGAYCMIPKPSGPDQGPGMIALEPKKDGWSHVVDCCSSICVEVSRIVKGDTDRLKRNRWGKDIRTE